MANFTNQKLRRHIPSSVYNEIVNQELDWVAQVKKPISDETALVAAEMLALTNSDRTWENPADPYTQAVREEIKGVLNEFQGKRRVEGK